MRLAGLGGMVGSGGIVISPFLLREVLTYDRDTGLLTWIERGRHLFQSDRRCSDWNSRYAGKRAFTSKTAGGYHQGKAFGVLMLAHRVCWAIHHASWPTGHIDHLNGARDMNGISNLRDVTRAQNSMNAGIRSDNKSGVCGVSKLKNGKGWQSYINERGKRIALGEFSTFEGAVAARSEAEGRIGYSARHGT